MMVEKRAVAFTVATMRGELLDAERVHSIVAAFFTVYNYFGGGGLCEAAYRGALVVDDRVIVESKATGRLPPSSGPQLIGYLRATIFQVGVLLHFGPHPKFYRFVDSMKKVDSRLDRIRSNSRNSRPQTLGPPEREESALEKL
jgi:hypothetical protein